MWLFLTIVAVNKDIKSKRKFCRVAEQLKTWDFSQLGNIRKVSKPHKIIA